MRALPPGCSSTWFWLLFVVGGGSVESACCFVHNIGEGGCSLFEHGHHPGQNRAVQTGTYLVHADRRASQEAAAVVQARRVKNHQVDWPRHDVRQRHADPDVGAPLLRAVLEE
jgi:hypothetical protein